MKIQFTQNYESPTYKYSKDQIIDSSERPEDQITRWLNRGLMKPVDESPKRTAVQSEKRKATK